MPAKVLYRHVPEWFAEQEPFVRAEVRRAVQRFLGGPGAEDLRAEVENAPLDRLISVWNRIPYIQSPEELLDPDWRLAIEPLSMRDLLRAGFERPLKCGLFLELPYKSSKPPREALVAAAPWLALLGDADKQLRNLRYGGWLLFSCPSRAKAVQLQAQVKGRLLRCTVLGSKSGAQGDAS